MEKVEINLSKSKYSEILPTLPHPTLLIYIDILSNIRDSMTDRTALLLKNQLKEVIKNPVDGFSAGLADEDNLYVWDIMIMGPNESL